MAEEVGVRINGKFYPVPTGFTLGEARTIKQMTKLNLSEFGDALEKIGDNQDFDVMAGFVWLHMHREDPRVTPEMVDTLEVTDIEFVGPEPQPEQEPRGDDGDPPTGGPLSPEPPGSAP